MAQFQQPQNVNSTTKARSGKSSSVSGSRAEAASDTSFVDAPETVDPDMRHRLISEAAYRLFAERGRVDGYDVDDWLHAEAAVDDLLIGTKSRRASQ